MNTPWDSPHNNSDPNSINRRDFLVRTGAAATAGFLWSSGVPLFGQSSEAVVGAEAFDIHEHLKTYLAEIGLTPEDAGGTITFTGSDPIIPSHFRIASSMAIPAMAAAVGAAAIYKDRTGEGQDLSVDLRESLMNVNPLLGIVSQMRMKLGRVPADDPVISRFNFVPTVNGHWYQAPLAPGNPLTFVVYELKDGRFCTLTGAYPHLMNRVLQMLGVNPERKAIAGALKKMDSEELESTMSKYQVVGGIHRTTEEWLEHPQGKYLASVPLIEIVKVGDSDPMPFAEGGEQPLSGIKALTLTHVIAGTCAARTLAEYGADVIHIARDQSFEHEALVTDVNVGMRSSFLDLKQQWGKDALKKLVPDTDVFIEGFRGRSIENLGFGVEDVVKARPGVIYLSVRAYGWDGPWRDLPGFDMEALTVTGFTMGEGGAGSPAFDNTYPTADEIASPAFPATLVLNDYVAGYLGASGVIAALRRRAKEGGSYHVRISLSRAAMWYASLGKFPNKEIDISNPDHLMIPIEGITGQSPYGEIYRLPPQVKLSRTPGRWRDPLVAVRGGDRPVW